MDSRDIVETALRVLKCWTAGQKPTEVDVLFLRKHALPGEADLELDDVACSVVARECRTVIASCAAERAVIQLAS